MPRFITVARACTRMAGTPTRNMVRMMALSGRKPRKERRTMELRRTIHSPTTMPTTWPSTVARAAPATSIRGKGPMPKMSKGSRMRLITAPMPWMTIGPTVLPVA